MEETSDQNSVDDLRLELSKVKFELEQSKQECDSVRDYLAKVIAEKQRWRRVALNWTLQMEDLQRAFEKMQDGIDSAHELELKI